VLLCGGETIFKKVDVVSHSFREHSIPVGRTALVSLSIVHCFRKGELSSCESTS
jgi:hypothetical protein